MKTADWAVIVAVFAVTTAAFTGGAFEAGPRLIVGLMLAIAAAGMAAALCRGVGVEERLGFVFLVWAVLAAIIVGNNPLAAREVVTTWFITLIVWGAARRTSPSGVRLAVLLLIIAAVVVAIGVAAEAYGLGRLRVGGLLENPNIAASLLVVTLPLVFLHGVITRRKTRFVLAGILVFGVALSGSRAGLLAVLAAVALMWPRGRERSVALVLGGATVLSVLGWRLISQPDILAWFRPAIWRAVLQLWASHPIFGVGPGGLVDAAGPVRILHPDHVGQRQFLIAYAESTPLAVLVQTGIVGFLLLFFMVGLWLRRMRNTGLLAKPPLRGLLAAMVVTFAFHDLITAGIVLWWWALSLGLTEVGVGAEGESRGSLRTYRPPHLVPVLVTAFIVLWGLVQPSWARWIWRDATPDATTMARSVRAEPWYPAPSEWRVRGLLTKDSWVWSDAAEALAHARRLVVVEPGSASSWGGLALVYSKIVVDLGPWSDGVSGARVAFARATELEPHQPWHWLEWARFERSLGETEEASMLARRATEAEPKTVRAWLLLARIELDRGDVEKSRNAFEKAVESSRLRGRQGLNRYERELVEAPDWQYRELYEALR